MTRLINLRYFFIKHYLDTLMILKLCIVQHVNKLQIFYHIGDVITHDKLILSEKKAWFVSLEHHDGASQAFDRWKSKI